MSAVWCGKRLFEDSPVSSASTKRLRCASYVPAGYSPWPTASPASCDISKDEPSASIDRSKWVELFVREMSTATGVEDAKSRAFRALECFERFLQTRTTVDVEDNQTLRDENVLLKNQIQEKDLENSILKKHIQEKDHENSVLKRAVNIQHDHLKESEGQNQELKQLVNHQREQVRSLEVKNYALASHLQQALQSNPIPNRFQPDVF